MLHNSRKLLLIEVAARKTTIKTQNANKKSNSTRCKNRRVRRGYRIVSNSNALPSSIMFPCLCSLHVPVPFVRSLSFALRSFGLLLFTSLSLLFLTLSSQRYSRWERLHVRVERRHIFDRRTVVQSRHSRCCRIVFARRFELCLQSPWPASFVSAIRRVRQSSQRSTSVRSAQVDRLKRAGESR
jgi:hypothetical protein